MTRIISKISTNITVSSTTTIPPTTPQFTYLLPPQPIQLYSLQVSGDSNLVGTKYSYLIVISSIIQDGNTYQSFAAGTTTFEFVPSTWQGGMPLAPGTQISVYAYNSGSATVDASLSVEILASVPT